MEDSRKCPKREFGDTERRWLFLYGHYQSGHLYRAGGVADQPALYLAAMRLIDSVVNAPKEP